MGWSITDIENTLEISEECGKELKALPECEGCIEQFYPSLEFDYDAMEHMDCLWKKPVQDVLLKHRVNGRITFGTLEQGIEFWGYEWIDGELTKLKGHVVFEPEVADAND